MRLDQLLEQFRRDSDDRAEPFLWSTEDVTDWLNEAEGEACERMRLLRDTRTYPIAAGDSGATAIHAHLFSVLRAWLVDAGGEIYTLEERDELDRRRRVRTRAAKIVVIRSLARYAHQQETRRSPPGDPRRRVP